MPDIRFGHVETGLGPMWVAETDAGVAAISRSEPLEAFPGTVDAGWFDAGVLPPIDLRGLASFERRVYELVRAIPAGETMTYGDVAAAVGSPRAARAVGNAMARCPLFPAVPCHRVVRAADGWSGWGGDPALKRRLLAAERDGSR